MLLHLIPISIAFFIVVNALKCDVNLRVVTKNGKIQGHWQKPGDTSVREFLGIPYGAPPVGNLRFAAPQKPKPWKGTFNASIFGPSCYQTKFLGSLGEAPFVPPTPLRESEDCLSVNVWTPNVNKIPRGGAAVMIWAYPGGFSVGTTDDPDHYGANFVRNQEGIIFVTFNRMSVFGLSTAFGLPEKEKNPALMDVRAAVEWARNNIAAFGGNPDKILLFGNSAGGYAADTYTYAYTEDPIIRAAILQSGTYEKWWEIDPPMGAAFQNISIAVGCAADLNERQQLECMRKVPAKALVKKVNELSQLFLPLPDNGTVLLDYDRRLEEGRFAQIPILVGSNDEEIPGNSSDAIAATKQFFTCPAARTATKRSKFVKTWMYRYFGNFPANPQILSARPYHTSEIREIFGTYNVSLATQEQIEASKYIQDAWAAFAKDPENGLERYGGWPTYDPEKPTLVKLSYRNTAKASFADPRNYHSGC